MTVRVAVVGASGYIGGELVRILIGHPNIELCAATSTRFANRRLDSVHPNLRGVCPLTFTHPDNLGTYDAIFLAIPHMESMRQAPELFKHGDVVIDLTADFRLADEDVFRRTYGVSHEAPGLLCDFVCGLPELYRAALRTANRISVPGCMATAAILALYPVVDAGLLQENTSVEVDARTGSSGSGMSTGVGDSHAERTGMLRVFAPTGHRHEAEITQATGLNIRMIATGLQAVRGVQVLCRAQLAVAINEAALRDAYRKYYAAEPFVRVVAQRRGLYRLPEPKLLYGSNFCDVGFALYPGQPYVLLISALDNLVKGGAGNAVQCMNIRFGWPERMGLEFPGLHPN
jgi:N-acetyl-gamma-glutamyl-phosphate/LysW-gamma-L-alpha-aminoadipyl-6-phosphate reductase